MLIKKELLIAKKVFEEYRTPGKSNAKDYMSFEQFIEMKLEDLLIIRRSREQITTEQG
jgi:hypothetical protein